MKNKIFLLISSIFLIAFLSTGCATCSIDLNSLFGTSIRDLENSRADGKTKIFPISFDVAFDEVMEIIKNNNLTIFQSNRKKGYIIAMGFHKQIDTTRVGIFFDSLAENQTQITLSSLSDTALSKAETIILGSLEK